MYSMYYVSHKEIPDAAVFFYYAKITYTKNILDYHVHCICTFLPHKQIYWRPSFWDFSVFVATTWLSPSMFIILDCTTYINQFTNKI